jgi:predicted nuclease with RNAse H fold
MGYIVRPSQRGLSMSFLGIDLSASTKRASYYALLDEQNALTHLDCFNSCDQLFSFLDASRPSLIAIDAPLYLPLGLDCLEEGHSCSQTLEHKGRTAEQELARMHIGCFFTTKRSIIKTLIYRGLKLHQELSEQGHKVVEVYPYATKVLLFGDKIPPKNSVQGLAFLKERLSKLIDGLDPYLDGLNHDGCDALLAAHTAYLHQENLTDQLGLAEEGYMIVPKLLAKVPH